MWLFWLGALCGWTGAMIGTWIVRNHFLDRPLTAPAAPGHGPVAWTVVSLPLRDLDAYELPCIDCYIGEPHMCPLLTWEPLYLDEWDGITDEIPGGAP
jgi:hypothetical protein